MRIFVLLLLVCTVMSCSYYQQHFFNSSLQKNDKGFYYHEDSTIMITYDFFASTGKVSILVYNKSDKVIYIDWKKSSIIFNSQKTNLWSELERTTAVYTPIYNTYFTQYVGSSSSYKPERITSIPPKSYYARNLGQHLDRSGKPLPRNVQEIKIKVPIEGFSGYYKTVKAYVIDNDTLNPLDIRAFIVMSFKESFDNEIYIDNSFKRSKFIQYRENNIEIPFDPTSYYLKVKSDSYTPYTY